MYMISTLALASSAPATTEVPVPEPHPMVQELLEEPDEAVVVRRLDRALRHPERLAGLHSVENLFKSMGKLQSLYLTEEGELDPTLSKEEAAHRAFVVARVARIFHDSNLVGTMVGTTLEQQALEHLTDLPRPRQLSSWVRVHQHDVLLPNLGSERKMLEDMVGQTWVLAPFTTSCLSEHQRVTQELEPLLALPPQKRTAALSVQAAQKPDFNWWTWHTGGVCWAGIPGMLEDWSRMREENDATWLSLAE